MDFNAIYKLNEADEMQNAGNQNPAAAAQGEQAGEDDGLPQDVHASEEALNIAMNQLQQVVKGFKNDGYILKMMEFYDGKTPKNESINMDGSNEKRLTEAKKGSFTAYYKQLTKSLSNTQKKIKIVALILIATAIVAGAGVGTVLIKKLVSGKKLLGNLGNASDKDGATGGDASGASDTSGAPSAGDNANSGGQQANAGNSGGQQANAGNSGANAQGGNTPSEAPQGNSADSNAQDSQGQSAEGTTNGGEASADGTDNAQSEVKPETVMQNLKPADNQIVNDVIKGKYGNYPFRANNLLRAGYNPISVQNAVNQSVAAKSTPGAVANPPKPQEVTKIVQTELDSGKLNVSDDGKVIPETPSADTANTQSADANANTNASASTQNNAQPSVQPTTQPTAGTTAQSVAQTAAQIAAATRSNGGQAPAQNPTPATNANAATTAQTAANGNNNAAYENWKKNPKNQKMLNNISAQARATGQNPEKAMKDAFDKGLLHTVNR